MNSAQRNAAARLSNHAFLGPDRFLPAADISDISHELGLLIIIRSAPDKKTLRCPSCPRCLRALLQSSTTKHTQGSTAPPPRPPKPRHGAATSRGASAGRAQSVGGQPHPELADFFVARPSRAAPSPFESLDPSRVSIDATRASPAWAGGPTRRLSLWWPWERACALRLLHARRRRAARAQF